MVVYATLFIFIYVLTYFDVIKVSKKNRLYIISIILTILAFFSGLRYGIGADYWGYVSYFNRGIIGSHDIELGFELLMVGFDMLMPSFEAFNIFLNCVIFFILYKSLRKLSYLYVLSIFVYIVHYYLGGPMGQMRQALSMVILLYSISYIIYGEWKKFIITVLVASSFHISALPFFGVYFFRNIEIRPAYLLGGVAIAYFIGQTGIVENMILNFTNYVIGGSPTEGLTKLDSIEGYITDEKYGAEYSGALLAYVERFSVLLVGLLLIKRTNDPKFRLLIYIYWMSMILFFLFYETAIFSQRISRPFKIVEIFLIPLYIQYLISDKYLRLIAYMLLAVMLYKPLYMIFARPYQYLPYSTIF